MSVFVKVRNLGQFGIIADKDPYDLPPQAFSAGKNVRFRNGRVSRAPVWRTGASLTNIPRWVFSSTLNSGSDNVFVCNLDGSVNLVTPSAQTSYSIPSYTASNLDATWTGVFLENVVYLNRPDRTPWYYDGTVNNFKVLTNWGIIGGSTQTWTAALLRSCGGALVALNMTINGANSPGMLITSEFPQAGQIPASWDYTSPSTSATQNTLENLEGGIIDACPLGQNLCIYGFNSTTMMSPTTAFEEFDYIKLPFERGAINANCSVEVDGLNYVFGPDDIWRHDGYQESSIATDRVRDYIFGSLNFAQTGRCFVQHNPALKEIYFCYVSGDGLTAFSQNTVTGCNRCATFNYADDNWTFDDLPSVYGATYANLANTQTWASISATWATAGGTWQAQDQNLQRTVCFVGDTNASYNLTQSLYAFDLYGTGSTTSFPVDTNATMGAHLERDGIDLDQMPDVDLPDYKLFSSVFPLARIDPGANSTLNITLGTSDYYGEAPTFDGPTMTFGDGDYRGDFNMQGRYAALHLDYNDYTTFSISGFDFLVDETGQR